MMTPEEKERWRWTFAGQAKYRATQSVLTSRDVWELIGIPCREDDCASFEEYDLARTKHAIKSANALIEALEASAQERCDHLVFVQQGMEPHFDSCPKCGLEMKKSAILGGPCDI